MAISEEDLMPAAVELIEAGNARGVPLRLVGGLAVRYLTPDFPRGRAPGRTSTSRRPRTSSGR